MPPPDLTRFIAAQDPVYADVLSELRSGQKQSHWMWFIFPQVAGLGRSPMSHRFAIKDLEEAHAYLRHLTLGRRLLECCKAVEAIKDRSATQILGSPDDLKLRSSLTLFAAIENEGSIFHRLIAKYFSGKADERTIEILRVH